MRKNEVTAAALSILALVLVQPGWADEVHPVPSGLPTLSTPRSSSPSGVTRSPSYRRSNIQPHRLNDRVYYGTRSWRQGIWRHESRHGRYGWWWDAGGVAYFYTARTEGPPDQVSEISEPDETGQPEPAPTPEPQRVYFYRPGDLDGLIYDTLEACRKAQTDAGGVGICVIK